MGNYYCNAVANPGSFSYLGAVMLKGGEKNSLYATTRF